ncbi:MAG: zinc-binding dehydrogenase [Bryobacteraceae bacterium]
MMPAVVNYARAPFSVELRDVPLPEIGERDVLLRTGAVGICGSDLHQWAGTASWPVNYPCILGHEFAGTVAGRGAAVRLFHEGDRVVSETAAVIDEASPYARRGLYNLDPARRGFGYGVDGAMTRFVRVPERCLHRIPDRLPFIKACLTEPCCVAYNSVCVNGRVALGDDVLVIGPGPIGLLCALMAKLSGAARVLVAGLPSDAVRLEAARSLGVEATAADPGPAEFDVVVDASGASAALETAMRVVRPAGQILKVGWGPQPLSFSIDPIVQKNVTLQGSFSHNWPIWERVIAMLASGQLDITPLIGRVAPLASWRECFEQLHAGEYVKAVLTTEGV